jgi:hypothetical protein
MRINRILAVLAIPFAVIGCGGTGTGLAGGNSSLVGTFRSNFTRGAVPNTSFVLFVDDHGHAAAQINSTTEVEWVGQGTLIGNKVSITMQAVSAAVSGNVLCQGTVIPGVPPAIAITLSGAVTSSSTATQIAGVGVNPAAHSYSGTFTGSENGTFNIAVDDQGVITGTLDSPSAGNNLTVQGSENLNGAVSFQYQVIGFNATYIGYLFLPSGSTSFKGSGTWSVNSSRGTWQANQLLTPGK